MPSTQAAGPGGKRDSVGLRCPPGPVLLPPASTTPGSWCDHRHESQFHAGKMIRSLVTTVFARRRTAFKMPRAVPGSFLIFAQSWAAAQTFILLPNRTAPELTGAQMIPHREGVLLHREERPAAAHAANCRALVPNVANRCLKPSQSSICSLELSIACCPPHPPPSLSQEGRKMREERSKEWRAKKKRNGRP